MLKLYYSSTSPYVRKVMAVAHELGLADRIETLPASAHPIDRDENIARANPLAKVPAAVTDDGLALYDSRVICEYLDAHADGRVFPREGAARWQALTRQALGDGMLDAALLARYEVTARPADKQWPQWVASQLVKVRAGVDAIEREAAGFAGRAADIGTITLACALAYADLRFPELAWRDAHPRAAAWYDEFSQHPAMVATRPL